MIRTFTIFLAVAGLAVAAEKSLQLKDLPPAVQKFSGTPPRAAKSNIAKEVEKGVTQYEVESILAGKHRDFNVDSKGGLIVVEDEVSIDAFPAPAKAAVMKKVGAGKLGMCETVTKGSTVLYEAAYTTKAGKKGAVLVKADGTETKD
jgi:hypothetical protein